MGKISCFSGLLGGTRKTSKSRTKIAYPKKVNGNDCPKVKPVEFMDMEDTVDVVSKLGGGNAPARDTKVVAHAAAEPARHDHGENDDKASIKDAGLVAGEDSPSHSTDDTGRSAGNSEPSPTESSVGRVPRTASPKLKRSCSNIETASSVRKVFDLPAKSRSYGDLKTLPVGRLATPSGAPDASPTASVKTSYSADRVMLKKRSSRQVLPSRSRKLWWRLFLWSHRNLHRSGVSATMPTLLSAGGGAPHHQHDGYTSDTLDAVTAASADAKNKEVAEEEEPIPSQWVAFSAEASPLDRVSAWVNSLENGSFHADAVDEVDVTERGDVPARPQCPEIVEIVEPSTARKSPVQAKRRTADEAVQACSVVQTLNSFSAIAHIFGMGLKVVPMIAAFTSLRSNLPWIVAQGPAHARPVEEQDCLHRGATGTDEAARAEPQLQPDRADRTRAVELHGDQGALPRREQDQRRGGPAPPAQARRPGPELQQDHHGQVPGPARGQLRLPACAQPAGEPGAGQRRRRNAPQGRVRPAPADGVPQQAGREAAARAGGGQRQRRPGGARQRWVGLAQAAGSPGEPEPRPVVGQEPRRGEGGEQPQGQQDQVQDQAPGLLQPRKAMSSMRLIEVEGPKQAVSV